MRRDLKIALDLLPTNESGDCGLISVMESETVVCETDLDIVPRPLLGSEYRLGANPEQLTSRHMHRQLPYTATGTFPPAVRQTGAGHSASWLVES